MARTAVTDEVRPGEREHRAQAFAAARYQVPCERRDQRHFALHAIEDHLIDLVHAMRRQGQHGFDGAFQLLALQGDNFG